MDTWIIDFSIIEDLHTKHAEYKKIKKRYN